MYKFDDVKNIDLSKNPLNDIIFKKIEKNPKKFFFVSKSTKKSIKNYRNSSTEQNIKNLWKDLLIDSICLLKINDRRESLYEDTIPLIEKNNNLFEKNFETIRLKSTYGINEIADYFDDLVEFESVLYGIGKSYRDHIHHVLQVWAVGIGLIGGGVNPINIKLSENFRISDECFHFQIKKNKSRSISKSEIWAMWIIIALCHDLGYPLEKASDINQKVKKIVTHFSCLNFNELNINFDLLNSFILDKFINVISSKAFHCEENCKKEDKNEDLCSKCSKDSEDYELNNQIHKTEIQQKYHDKFSKSLEEYKHGILSGLLIFKKLTYFLETDFSPQNKTLSCEDLRQFYIRKEILRSISGHTCPKIYHLDLNTFSFLLILCDELQEWGRPKFKDFFGGNLKDNTQVTIKSFITDKQGEKTYTTIHVEIKYNEDIPKGDKMNSIEKDVIKKRFKNLLCLLRSAKDDKKREIDFTWEILFNNIKYSFIFISKKNSYEMYNIRRDNKPFELFKK